MNEEKYLQDFNIISLAGMAKSQFILAIKEAKRDNFEKAEELLKMGEEQMNEAHRVMFKMLQQESLGEPVEVNIVTVHAQDHITMATMMYEMAIEMIDLYKRMSK
ncbi:MAG: PTS lactose/cellobiose transporter subunit IIA [Erysipelotrichaceae bacterium]|nr:PTS lactose/cellobiose transporter subunit IIA [Erysipelotrichaceae bacterium]